MQICTLSLFKQGKTQCVQTQCVDLSFPFILTVSSLWYVISVTLYSLFTTIKLHI